MNEEQIVPEIEFLKRVADQAIQAGRLSVFRRTGVDDEILKKGDSFGRSYTYPDLHKYMTRHDLEEIAYDLEEDVKIGIEQSAKGETEYLGSFSQYLDDKVEVSGEEQIGHKIVTFINEALTLDPTGFSQMMFSLHVMNESMESHNSIKCMTVDRADNSMSFVLSPLLLLNGLVGTDWRIVAVIDKITDLDRPNNVISSFKLLPAGENNG